MYFKFDIVNEFILISQLNEHNDTIFNDKEATLDMINKFILALSIFKDKQSVCKDTGDIKSFHLYTLSVTSTVKLFLIGIKLTSHDCVTTIINCKMNFIFIIIYIFLYNLYNFIFYNYLNLYL